MSKCIKCGEPLNADAAINESGNIEKGHSPDQESISICLYCGNLGMYDKDLNIVELSDKIKEEIKKDKDLQKAIKEAQEISDLVRKIKELKEKEN